MTSPIALEATPAIADSTQALGPLAVLLSPSGHYAIEAGETFEISLTLHNQGTQGAVIDAYIDENSTAFCQWCSNPYERLALETGHSSEVRFKVAIPPQTLPGTYDYLIVVDAPNHYPEDTPLRYPAKVRVLPPVKAAVDLNDATFATRPDSRSDRPIDLPPDTPTELQVVVHNRANRVDQFRLEIGDLPASWVQIAYPEGLGELGLVVDTDHLALNPGVKGLIRVWITCPSTTLAGRYLATLQLRSANDADLVLMDVAYFEVPARYDLTVQAEAIVRKVKRQAALFHLHLTNAGNTARTVTLDVREDREDPLFTYDLTPSQLHIPSMSTACATLTASPDGMRRRAWIGRGRQVSFRLEMDDQHDLPLPAVTTAELLWERRPWWHMALVLLLAAGVVSTAVGIIWWLFLRPPAPPKVTAFSATAPTYYQQRQDFIHLNWQIAHPDQIQTLELSSDTDADGTTLPPVTYDLSDGLPPELRDRCVLDQVLSCSHVITGARQPGTYQFTLTVVPDRASAQPITADTGAIAILPTPPPDIVTFAATQNRYWEALDPAVAEPQDASESLQAGAIALNWTITFTEPLSHLMLAGRLADGGPLGPPERYDLATGLPDALKEYCTLSDRALTCRAVPTSAKTVGAYTFELTVFAVDQADAIATASTEAIAIVPAPVQIERFTLNGQPVPAKYRVTLPPNAEDASIQLAWRVSGGPHTQVELLPTPGSVSLVGDLEYPLTANTQAVLTLRATSVNGEDVTQSVVIETVQPEPSSSVPPAAIAIPPPPPPRESAPPVPTTPAAPSQRPPRQESTPAEDLRPAPAIPEKPAPPVPPKPVAIAPPKSF